MTISFILLRHPSVNPNCIAVFPKLHLCVTPLIPRLVYLQQLAFKMAFYYNYTGPQPGSVNRNRVDRTPAAKAEEAASPWLAAKPKQEAQATANASCNANGYYVYRPRYDAQPAPVKQTEPANPWLASPPVAVKASTPHAHSLRNELVSHGLTSMGYIACAAGSYVPSSLPHVLRRSPPA